MAVPKKSLIFFRQVVYCSFAQANTEHISMVVQHVRLSCVSDVILSLCSTVYIM